MSEYLHDKKCEWEGEEPCACDCRVRVMKAELAAAKAEIESVKTHHRYDLEQFRKCQDENNRLLTLNAHVADENLRLREALEEISEHQVDNELDGRLVGIAQSALDERKV